MGSFFSNKNPAYLVGNDESISNPEQLAEMSDSAAKRQKILQPRQSINVKYSYQSTHSHEHTIIDIDEQLNIPVKVHESKTIWHIFLSHRVADWILAEAQSSRGVCAGVILVVLYCIGLFTFDTDLLGWIAIIYSCVILLFAVPGVVLYFGTLNSQICIGMLKQFPFWYKMYNVLMSNIMEVIWAYDVVEFNLISRQAWFTIYGLYFFVNIVATSMGCLLDGFKWPKALRIGGPLLLSAYFMWGAFYWHYINDDNTTIKINLFGPFKKDFLLSYVAASADFSASVFLFSQAMCVVIWPKQASVLQATVTVNWK